MHSTRHIFIGREAALSELGAALERAREGLGGLQLVLGEAGIGKTRLAEALAEQAHAAGIKTLWGRAWEAGGAPAYWPFSEVLRGLLRQPGAREQLGAARRSVLAQLAPEPREDAAPTAREQLLPEQARFVLLEALVSALCDASTDAPLLMVLEDMHAADADSLLALELLAAQARASRLLIVVTARPAPLTPQGAGAILARTARVAGSLSLTRLTREQVQTFLAQALGRAPEESAVDAMFHSTEGNPLFLVELTRLWAERGTLERIHELAPRALPQSVRAVIAQRLDGLVEETRNVLEAAAVLGREFREELLANVLEMPRAALDAELSEAVDRAVLEVAPPDGLRFSHVLLRDGLYAALPEARRQHWHRRAADALARRARGLPAWPLIAHHLLAAGPEHSERAVEAARCAAEQAAGQLAFDEAVSWYERALEAEQQARPDALLRLAELSLLLARARSMAGDTTGGRALCVRAAALARELRDPELLARVALECGRAFVFGHVDRQLVALLEEALARLDDIETSPARQALRARLMARHAAARQPAANPLEPIAEAREAVALARSLGDPAMLLETLRSATSAMADLGDPEERAALNEELARLAQTLDEPFDALRAYTRLSLDRFELGEQRRAEAAVDQVMALAERLDVPHVRWIALGLCSMRALREGRFAESERLAEQALALGRRARDRNAEPALRLQHIARLNIQGRWSEALASLPQARAAVVGVDWSEAWRVIEACMRALGGEPEPPLAAHAIELMLQLGDPAVLQIASQYAHATRNAALAARLEERLAPRSGRVVVWGALGLCVEAPVDRYLGLLAATQGRLDEGVALLTGALAQAESTRAWPDVARIGLELAGLLQGRAQGDDRERAQALEHRARELARELGMRLPEPRPSVVTRVEQPAAGPNLSSRPDPRDASLAALALARTGELWSLRWQGALVHLEDCKGLRYLAQLLAAPGQSFHVLELSGADPAQVDRSDLGPVLDATAVGRYKQRIATLRRQLDDTEDGDQSLATRAELEALEDQLVQALGLGGRSRRTGSQVERARVNVQRRLRDALRRIDAHFPELARTLDRAISTGVLCVYDP